MLGAASAYSPHALDASPSVSWSNLFDAVDAAPYIFFQHALGAIPGFGNNFQHVLDAMPCVSAGRFQGRSS